PVKPAAPPPPPKAWILVDDDTGAIIDAGNEHEPLPPASVTKVLTALVAVERLPVDAQVPVSPRAEAMPALRIGMRAGQVWNLQDSLHALLMVSANDAAVALAERVSGSLDAFTRDLAAAAARLHMDDSPILHDPAGLDDQYSFDGGNRISARDLAIATRAALTLPVIRSIVATPYYPFTGPDGQAHHMRNHNLLLTQYPGAIGVKTGFTRKAGASLIGAATRNGRTMLTVLLGAPDRYRTAEALMDKGFATPVAAEASMAHLPAVPPLAAAGGDPGAGVGAGATDQSGPPITAVSYANGGRGDRPDGSASHDGGGVLSGPGASVLLLVLGSLPVLLIALRRRAVRLRRERRRRQFLARAAQPSPMAPASHAEPAGSFDPFEFDLWDDEWAWEDLEPSERPGRA
ncbi:MAG: D-alanyl-D-alanine carboxypeptidase family protein, partial [Acidimicrobiales bacterium]